MTTKIKEGTFPLAARAVETWTTQTEINNLAAYLLGHKARNVRATLNLAAVLSAGEEMRRVFATLKEEVDHA